MLSRRVLVFILSSTLLVSAGCELPVMRARLEEIPRKTTQQLVRDVHSTPEVARLVEELSREATHGAVEGLSDEETAKRLNALVAQLSRAMLDEVADSVRGPAGREITAGVTSSMIRSLEGELSQSVGPAMRRMIVDELLRQPEFRQALNETSHDIGKQVALGTTEAIAQAAVRKKQGLLSFAADLLPPTAWLAIVFGLLLVLGVPLAMLLRERRATRRYHEDIERRTAVATALLHAAEAERDEPALRAAIARIAASLAAEEVPPGPAETRREVPPGGTLRPA